MGRTILATNGEYMFSTADTPEEILLTIGRRIAEHRRALRLSQADLAVRAGVSKRMLERLESGAANPRLDALVRVCLAMGLVEGFEQLLPAVELGPLAVARGERIPLRVHKRKVQVNLKWKED